MRLHVQCDRCKKFAEAVDDSGMYRPSPPVAWFALRAFSFPVRMNEGYPAGGLEALLCGDCMPVVQKAAEAAIARRT